MALAVLVVVGRAGFRHFAFGGTGRIQALAVLPLVNISGDPEQEYFADGMTEGLITDLARIEDLRVISRTSVMQYKDARKPLRQIAKELGVDAVVEGSVQRSGERVRITANLIRASNEKSLWTESYERDLTDVLSLQGELTTAIASKIQIRLEPAVATMLSRPRSVRPEAYQAYLKGRYSWNKFNEAGFNQAEEFFRRAIEVDPEYAPAWAGLADTYYGRSNLYLPPNVAIPQARAAAEKALALDESLPEAHTSLGIVEMVYDWDWKGAEEEFERAIRLRPGDAYSQLWLGQLLVATRRFDEGIARGSAARTLDPRSPYVAAMTGWALYYARRFDRSVEVLMETLRMDPDYYLAHGFLGGVRQQQGDFAAAIASLERTTQLDSNPDGLSQLGNAYASAGREEDARRILEGLLERSKREFIPAYDIGMVYTALGEKDLAIEWFERALEDHSELLIYLWCDPRLDSLRSDSRFQSIIEQLGFEGLEAAGRARASS